MKTTFACTMAAVLLVGTPALATTPVISGKYIVTVTKFCQMANTYHFSSGAQQSIGNYLDGINTSGSTYKQSMFTASFSPAKAKVTIDGFDNGGDIEIFKLTGSINSTMGEPITQEPNSGKVPYSNTDTTITIGDQTYNALFGQVKKSGIAGW